MPLEVANAFADIATRAGYRPRSVTTDQGAEFGPAFQTILEKEDIQVQQKDPYDVNAIATLDNAIGNFKKALARDCRSNRTDNWAARIGKVTAGQNNLPNDDYLDGVCPARVATSPELIDYLQKKNAGFDSHNVEQMDKRKEKLEGTGHFRKMVSAMKFTRGWKPKWSAEIHAVRGVSGAHVSDETGKQSLSKFAQPVPADSTEDHGPRVIEHRGSKLTESKQRAELAELKDEAEAFLRGRGGPALLSVLAVHLAPLGFVAKAKAAGLNMKSATAAFLRVYPETFRIDTPENGGTSRVSLQSDVPAPAAHPVARASASGSSGSGLAR